MGLVIIVIRTLSRVLFFNQGVTWNIEFDEIFSTIVASSTLLLCHSKSW